MMTMIKIVKITMMELNL